MSRIGRTGFGSRRRAWGLALALAGGWAAPAGAANYNVAWKDSSTSGWWSDGAENRWYRFDDGWDVRREDLATGQWDTGGTKNYNNIFFGNGVQASMTVNALGGTQHYVASIWFSNSTSRTFAQDGGAFLMLSSDGTPKIEAASGSGTGTYTFNVPIQLAKAAEFNPVGGNLVFNAAITNGGYWINVYGNLQKTLTIGGVLSGSGGLANKQDNVVVLTNNNAFTGGIWVEKGTVQLANHTNALGLDATLNVGTNATLDFQGSGTLWPSAINLYGTGTNATMGALRKTTAGALTLRRAAVALGASSRIVVTGGGLTLYSNIVAGANTLYLTNTVNVTMSGGEMTGTATAGDGALRKSGSADFELRPGAGLTGSIFLDQGAIRQSTGNGSVLPSGGLLVLSNSTTYRSDSTTARTNAKAVRIDGDVTLGYSGGGRLTFSGDVNLNAGQRSISAANDATVSGAITNGGLTKAGSGTLVLLGANTYALGTLISAGVLQVGSNGTAGSISGNVTNNAALAFYRTDSHTFGGAISGTGALTNLAGTLTLSGTSTYSGPTTVAGGTLLVSGAIGSSAVTVGSGATLAGAGTVGSIAGMSGGTVSPGNTAGVAGTLTVGGAAALGGGTYTCDVTGTGSTACDLISASGAIGAASALTINLSASAPAGFSECTSYSWTIMSGSSASAANMSIGTKWASSGTFAVSASGNTIVVTHTPGAPGKPTVAASDGTATAHVALSWDDVSCETGYVIRRNTVDTYASATAIYTNAANATTYNDAAADPGQLYYYWVTATNAGGSTASDSNPGYRRLAAPGNLAATDGASTANVTVTWDAVTGASTYHLYRDTDSTPAGATALGPQSSGYADAAATPGQLYYYWVVASNSTSSSTGDWSVADSGYRKLTAPANVAATENLSDKVTVTWDDVTGETGFGIWRHTADVSGSAACIGSVVADVLTYDDTTAAAGQTYYYWVRATNSTSASLSDFSASDTGLKTLSEPTTAASAIVFGDLGTVSYTVSWTRGNGDSVLVVARQGAAPADPTDSVVYAADATLGLGDVTAAGSYVVYKGTGTNVTVSGLSAGTEYTFAVYEFNGVATPNYRTSDEPTASRTTLVAEPTTQASAIAVGTVNEVSLASISWTDGNGASRLVVVKAGSAVDAFPADGASYTANAAFGSGSQIGTGNYVVHAGSGPLATLSGLTRDVVYHFRAFEFNGSGGSENYLTNAAAGNPTNQATLAVPPSSNPTDLTIAPIGTNGFTVTWTKGTTGTNTLIVIRAGGNPVDPTDLNSYAADPVFGSGANLGSGSYVVYGGTGSSVAVTNLAPGTSYTVEATSFNGSGGSENYRATPTSATGSTLMPEPTQASALAFGTLGATSYAVSYTAGSGLSRLVVAKQGGAVDWTPTDGTAYAGENNAFGSGTELSAGNFLVHRGTSPFTLSGLTAATDYHLRIFEYQGTNATLNYNVSAATGNPSNRYALSTEPTVHGTLSATALSDTEIKLDWTDATGESGYVIVRQAADAGWTAPADGTAYTAGNALGAGTVVYAGTTAGAGSYTNASLSADTTYYYRIYPYAYDGTAAHATHNYYVGGTPGSANAATGKSEPGTSSSVVGFLPASGTTATISWTNTGTADGTIILVKSGSAVSSNPSDWTGYAADLAFGSGAEIGTGNFVVVAGAGKHGSATITGLSAGTTYHVAVYPYNGTGSFLNYRTTSPGTASVLILPDPSAATATADGKTLIDLAWTKHASYDVMIVHKSGSASTAPTQGQAYSAGDACGGGTVIYKGSGAALEHVVASGTTHHYAFYSYSGNSYSAGLTDSEATSSFVSGEVVETFSYTNGTALTGLAGETGWGGGWYGDVGEFTNSAGSFATQTNYPAPSGNKIRTTPPNDTSRAAFRPLGQEYKSGRIYFGYVLNYQYEGANKYAGLSLFWTNSSEKLFIGEIYGQDQQLGIDNTGSAYTLTKGPGNDYVVVGYYDWAAGEAKAKAYQIGVQAVPTDEPSSWDVTVSKASNSVGTVNAIRLAAGAGAGAGTPGDVYFDEVRIATNWAGIVLVAPTKPAWPTNQAATADGSEMARLAWTKNGAGNDVMVVHKTGPITTEPTDGTGYSAGNTIDGGTVIYKGSATALEHVVNPGTTNFYKFYSVNAANYYSTGVVAAATNAAYGGYEKVNPFSYTNGIALGSTTMGGQGFGANFWSVDSGTWTVQTNYPVAVVDDVPRFMDMDGYPDMQGNRVYASITSDGGVAKAQRSLASTISTGKFYVAYMLAYQFRGANKWAGLSLLNAGGTEKAFLGKGAGANYSTLGIGDGATTYWSAYDLGQYYSSDTYGNTGNVYLVVGKYDFDTDVFQAKAYRIVDGYTFPETEPATWDVSQTMAGIDAIARIQLNAGASVGAGYPGKVFYDEIRYGTDWAQLIAVTCPTWAGSNTLNSAAWTAAGGSYLGDTENFQFQSFPVGLGQSGSIEFDWAQNAAFASAYPMAWWQNANNNSYWTNQVQMTAAGTFTSRFAAAGSGCGSVYTNNPALTVSNLVAPSGATATRDGTYTNSQINLEWVRGVSGTAKDTLVVRQTADAGWTAPVNGATYNPGDSLGSGTVVYRGAGTTASDTGLAPSTTYYYRFYSENWTYYSVAYAAASASTAAGTQEIAIDGSSADWRGTASPVLNSSASSLQEYIWTDKRGELRVDHADHPNADVQEFRIYADADWVYFLVKMTNITDVSKPFVAIGVDTRTNSASTAMNWLGDDSGTFVGDGYFEGGAAHFPEYQLNVHAAGGGAKIELYAQGGTAWYAPATGGNTNVAISAANDVVELKVARADLNLAGTKTARFTVAAFLNTGVWNNDGDGTTHIADNTAAAVDTLSIPPWGTADNAANLSAWLEDVSDADVDFWMDVQFAAGGLTDNAKPAAPVLTAPTNTAAVTASPTLGWQVPADADGKVTGYLLEISTNEQFNGVAGTENGPVDLRVNLYATTTNYTFTTSATQYWWRVRARDTAGELSAATTRSFRVVGKLDTEGPQPTLMYIGTNVAGYLAGDYDAFIAQYGPIQSVLDREIRDTNNVFGFVIRWTDASGVYATNKMRATDSPPNGAGGFAYNIVDTDGRVSPNWDLVEIDSVGGTTNDLWGVDRPFYATNTLATGNADAAMTNYVMAAFNVTNYDPTIEYYLTVSAEDTYSDGGSWWAYGSWPSFTNSGAAAPYYSGWCEDGPNTARNITTNFLIQIHVTDDDIVPPAPSQALGWGNDAALVVSNAAGALDYVSGTGQDVLYQITDGALIGEPLSFSFNAYDAYYTGVALGTTETFVDGGHVLTNTAFVAAYWQTNWANYNAGMSLVADTTAAGTMLTWHWPAITTQDVTRLWGPDGLSGPLGVTNLIQLDLFDVDNDRDGDQAGARQNFGRIRLEDDDPVDPTVVPETLSVTGTGLAREYVLTNLVEWTFPSGADDGTPAPTTVATDLQASDISHGPAGALSGTTNVFMQAQFYKPASNRWLTFTLEATGGKTFKATSISFDSRVSSLNGPDLVELYGTMPGGSETLWASNAIDLSDSENPIGTNWNSYSTSLAMPHATNSAVTFRLQARVADTNHLVADANANWYVDNLTVSGYVLGPAGGAQITDHDLAYGTATFSLQAADVYSGIDGTIGATGRAPRVDFWNESQAVVPITNAFVTNGWAATTNATLTLSGAAPAAADRKQISLGGSASLTYYARFTATDADVDRDGDWRSVAFTTTNTVYDEDTSRPARGYLFGGPLGVTVDGALTRAVGSGNNREYRINDEQLQTASATSIAVKVNLYDYSGWTVPTLGFSNSVAGAMSTNGWLTSVHTDDVNTTNLPDAAMEWRLSQAQANTLFGSYESVTNEFRVVSVWDKDDDRLDAGDSNVDNLELSGARLGYVTFLDNDVGQANVQSNWSASRGEWRVPQVFLGLPGDAARSNLYLSGLPADTNSSTVLSDLTNRVYDSQLAKVSAAAPLSVVLPAFDTGGGGGGRTIKGVQRGTALTQVSVNGGYHITNSSISIGSVAANNATNYRSDLSSSLALTRIAAQFPTSVWTFAAFSYAQVGNWLAAEEALANHVMAATLADADDNRAGDQRIRAGVALGTLQVVDNDTVAPSLPANVTANGVALSGPLTRETAAWTNAPTFVVRFEPSADGAPAGTDLERTGVAEHRVATDKADVGPDTGTPLAVPSEGSLANPGFESGATNWTLSGAAVVTEQAYEGTHSLKMTGSTAVQTVPLHNTNGYVPRVTVASVQFMGAAVGTLTVDGLDAAGAAIPGETFDVPINGAAGVWTAGSSAATDLDATVDRVRVTLTSVADTYWDDVAVAIVLYDGATPVDEASAVFTATEQGLVTNYLFAVDRDNNRPGDRKASSDASDETIPAFGTAYDATPPTAVPDVAATTDEVGDPTTQFDVLWDPDKLNYEVGPDDPTDDNHPTQASADRDILSPWRSYKIYYGTFDPADVPPGDPGPGFAAAYVYTNFVATGAYTNWLSVSATNAILDPSGTGTNYLALTNRGQDRIRLFDLDFDQEYALVVVGLDRAGNEGPATPGSWATNNTIKFAVTQGTLRAFATAPTFPAAGGTNTLVPWTAPGQKAAALYWLAAGPTNAQGGYDQVTKDYDLIHRDAASFQETNWTWSLSGSVRTNWFVETNAFNLPRGTVRFYRASYKDRWRRTNAVSGLPQRPLASEEVYALHNVVISEGKNHVGLHGEPYTNTFAGVFGTDTNVWPAGASAAAGATRVEFYAPGTNAPVSDVYFFATDANWYKESPLTKVTTNLQAPGFFTRGFSITLPTNLAARGYATTNAWTDFTKSNSVSAMVWHPILRVPTNGFTQTIAGGTTNDPMYNVVALNLPVAAHPSQLNLPANFTKRTGRIYDSIYTINTTIKEAPAGEVIYCAASNGMWYFTKGGLVPTNYFKPNDILVIVEQSEGVGNSWEWTYHPTNFYELPTRWMGE